MQEIAVQILRAIALLVLIVVIYFILQVLSEKGVKPLKNDRTRWGTAFVAGVLLFLLITKVILA